MNKYYIEDFEIKEKEITSIIGTHKQSLINKLKKNYNIAVVEDLFKHTNKLVDVIIPNSKRSQKIIKLLGLEKLLKKNYEDLGIEDKCLVKITSYLAVEKNIIIFNDILSYLNNEEKSKVIKYIKSEKTTLLNFTSDIEETLLGKNIAVLNNNKVVLKGLTMEILKAEKKLKDLGLYLPFVIDLSIQLNLYGLIKKIYSDSKKLIGDLWK